VQRWSTPASCGTPRRRLPARSRRDVGGPQAGSRPAGPETQRGRGRRGRGGGGVGGRRGRGAAGSGGGGIGGGPIRHSGRAEGPAATRPAKAHQALGDTARLARVDRPRFRRRRHSPLPPDLRSRLSPTFLSMGPTWPGGAQAIVGRLVPRAAGRAWVRPPKREGTAHLAGYRAPTPGGSSVRGPRAGGCPLLRSVCPRGAEGTGRWRSRTLRRPADVCPQPRVVGPGAPD
jgi:hypothetical protein